MTVKFLYVFSKESKGLTRDKKGLAYLLAYPLLTIIIFSFAFGSGSFLSGGSLPHEIAVVNNDVGVALPANHPAKYVNYGDAFTGVLENATADDKTTPLFHLHDISEDTARDMLKSRNLDALIVIPKNFSGAFAAMVNNSTRMAITSSVGQQAIDSSARKGTPAVSAAKVSLPKEGNASSFLIVEGDEGYINFVAAQGLTFQIFDNYKDAVRTNAVAAVSSGQMQNVFNDSIPPKLQSITGTQSFSLFDYMVPGLIAFTILLQANVVSRSLVRDVQLGLLDRVKLAKVSAFHLLFGQFLAWTLITIVQVIGIVTIAIVFGYRYQGNLNSLGLAVLIGVIAGMASISLALLVASFTKTEHQAGTLSTLIAVPLSLLAGAFIPLPRQVLGEYAGRTYQVYDLLPWTHAVTALRSVLTYGTGISADVLFEIISLTILTAILFAVGVMAYSRVRLKAEK
ncbi:MAG: ABC transporter permease [Halobacteriota archaeon]